MNCLKGAIGEFTMADIIQLISMGGKSGELVLQNGALPAGSIYFECGYVIHAHFDGLAGETAARALVAIDTGSFEFSPGQMSGEKSMVLTGPELLMRSAQSADEDAFLDHDGQLMLDIEDDGNALAAHRREQIKSLLRSHLGRKSRYPVAALETGNGSMDSLMETCERIEKFIALFIDENLAEEAGRKMREVMGLI